MYCIVELKPNPLLHSFLISFLNLINCNNNCYAFIIAKTLVLMTEVPPVKLWLEELASNLERIQFSPVNKFKRFNRVWHSLLQCIDNSNWKRYDLIVAPGVTRYKSREGGRGVGYGDCLTHIPSLLFFCVPFYLCLLSFIVWNEDKFVIL